ncbi:rhodanese-like domain-containing protein 6 isoform X2 [Durio zibethinus]|uniref:Rhodanese-like domain-containing protein 6 isoform X2 n=1 Tax=Durio zibethinus TaxID=66656 RepID=A0A6P5WUN7_DURZI|nr:rhodanese-like domain-containing protein 6 isoform X2 [Durio zibethinus]
MHKEKNQTNRRGLLLSHNSCHKATPNTGFYLLGLQSPNQKIQELKKKMSKDEYGVLLYYKYASIPDLNSLFSFYESNCNSLGLLGRVRLSPNGVNVTVGGLLSALKKHIEAVRSNSLFQGTDFKLASSRHPLNDKVALECGFTSLSIRVVKELVTFSSHPLLKAPEVSNAGRYLSASEFHSVLQSAGQLMKNGSPIDDKQVVLLDARNLYETRIGKFHAPSVETLDPGIRQYSDLPSWIDDNSEQLRGKHVLMYCTGGIRCEMASAYIRSKGAGFENVFQLFGGIQRYMERFPAGGFFRGKNFVFDHRISVGSSDTNIMGACLICGSSYDDYSSRCRCTHCRMLVLICDSCRIKSNAYICELCQKHHMDIGTIPSVEDNEPEAVLDQNDLKIDSSDSIIPSQLLSRYGNVPPRKLRILCLHGFRQNASSFKGRSASLAKKLKSIAELVFVDAPHELPFIYQSCMEPNSSCAPSSGQHAPPPENCKRKYAWLVAPDVDGKNEADWKLADQPFDPLQYRGQTDGFDVSLAHLKKVFSEQGPFDGILGFSQGAAMAALLSAQGDNLKGEIDFRFAILCSGFALPLPDFGRLPINCPSLHIFGSHPGQDRQITSQNSRYLASRFEDGCSVIIEHEFGHIIPTRSPYIDNIKDFLRGFL